MVNVILFSIIIAFGENIIVGSIRSVTSNKPIATFYIGVIIFACHKLLNIFYLEGVYG
jgi:hypothetical protein